MTSLSKFLLVLIVLMSMVVSVAIAQPTASFTPQNGPIGTVIFVDCGAGGTIAQFANQDITLDANGFGSFTVPTAYAAGSYQIACRSVDNVQYIVGNFQVTECPLLDERTLTNTVGQTINQYNALRDGVDTTLTGENIAVVARDTYGYVVDVDNGNGANMRLVISSSDPTRLVNYLNNATFDFEVYSPSDVNLAACSTSDIQMPFGSPQASNPGVGAVDVEFVLLSGASITPDANYLVYFAIASAIDPSLTHTFHPENATAIAGRLTEFQGFMSLAAWDENNIQGYRDAVDTYTVNVAVPGLMAVQPTGEADYRLAVNNFNTTAATYTLVGTYQTASCNPADRSCLGRQQQRSVVLTSGTGRSSGATVYNGNFEVEYFCQQLVPGSTVIHDDVNWYCELNNQRVQLTEQHFTQICRETYSNPEAFAVRDLDLTTPDDSQDSIPAFNWRCLGPENASG
jgi:hypothetical protein